MAYPFPDNLQEGYTPSLYASGKAYKDNCLHRFPTEGNNVTVPRREWPHWAVEAEWKSGELEQIGPEEYKVISERYSYWERTYGSPSSGTNHFKKGTILRTKNYR
jgi:hypothetical protein